MSQFAVIPPEPYLSFERGINRDAPRTLLDRGYYEDAVNMVLSSDVGGRHPSTVKLDSELDELVEWPGGNTVWFSPFTSSSYDVPSGTLSFATHLLHHRIDGSFWRYDAGAPGAQTLVRRLGLNAPQLTVHFVYDQWLCLLNGRDTPFKYGQHFLWDGQGETRPYLFPIGSKPISPLLPVVQGESHQLNNASFVADPSVPDGGARVGTHSLKVEKNGGFIDIDFATPRNFLAGPRPYGGTDFSTNDFLVLQSLMLPSTGSKQFQVQFRNSITGGNRFTFTFTADDDGTWQTTTLARSSAVLSGTPTWGSIVRIRIQNDDVNQDLFLDDFYFLYANAPPAAQVGTAHKDRIVLGGAPIIGANNDPALSTLFWSPVSKPDEFPSANVQIIAGGSTTLARTNRITALREYGDAVIIGTQSAIFAWTTGSQGDPTRSLITTETGIDSPRAIVETPTGSLIFPWQRGFYILRQTGRAYVSEKIAPILKDIWLEEPWWTMGVRDEKTKTIRFWFREKKPGQGNPSQVTTGIIFDYVRSQELGEAVWVSRATQLADFAIEAYVDGSRETLYCHFDDPHIHILGTTAGGTLESSITLPWVSLQSRDKIVKWIGLSVPYAASSTVHTFVRYANHPGEFDTAEFEELLELPAVPSMETQGRVFFGKSARWAQVKFQSQSYGFEIFPPVNFVAAPTQKPD